MKLDSIFERSIRNSSVVLIAGIILLGTGAYLFTIGMEPQVEMKKVGVFGFVLVVIGIATMPNGDKNG